MHIRNCYGMLHDYNAIDCERRPSYLDDITGYLVVHGGLGDTKKIKAVCKNIFNAFPLGF